MPMGKQDYSKGLIYKIHCKNPEITDIYVGSTTNFRGRKSRHKSALERNCKLNVYNFIRVNGGWDNWFMTEIEKYPCNDKRELEKREREVILELKASLNSQIPSLVSNTYSIYGYKKYKEEYNKINKDEILKKKKQKLICECGLSYSRSHKARHIKSQRHQKLLC
jgi:hypothetical protein